MVRSHKFDEDEADMVPIHWMGANKVEMMMVRKEDARVGNGVGRKEVMKAREGEKKAWKRLVKESERLLHQGEPEEEPLPEKPDPLADTAYRGQLLSSLRPPRMNLHGEYERRSQAASQYYPESENAIAERQSAANLITSLFRGESTRMGTKAMCPFSGAMVQLPDLSDHMDEWRSMMRAELMSLKMDAALGPKLGLFVVPEIPVEPATPTPESTPDEVKKWNDFAIDLMKCGYVLCKGDDRKYHWTELRKRLESNVVTHPWDKPTEQVKIRSAGSPRRKSVSAME